MAQSFTIRRERMALDLLLFQAYGVDGPPLLEAALQMNPGLADKGPFIPLGTVVTIPEKPARDQLRERKVVSLFG